MLLCACIGLTAQAQQLPNGNFDGDWEANYPYIGSNNDRTKGNQPVGWCVANVDGMKGTMARAVAAKIDGTTGNAVKLTNTDIALAQIAPGYMCLGTTWNTSTGLATIKNKDGGSFGGYAFQGYKPDAIEFMYQCAGGTGTVVAYLWKGTWTQKSVPVTTASMASGLTKVDMVDRDRNILGIAHSPGGEVTKSADAELIASLQESITDAPTSWTKRTIEFDYKNVNAAPEKINVIFAANDYFDSDNITKNNSLTVDDVKLVYYSQLKSISVNGTAINGFAEDKYEYTVDKEYTEGCLTTEVKGVAATQTVAYNEETGVATITVKGQDWTESNRNEHVYTVQFAQPAASVPALASLKISGEDFALTDEVTEYELPYVYNKGIVFEPVAGEASTLGETTYNDEEKTVSISVTNGKDKETVYVFRFGTLDETAAESGDYKGAISVVLQTTEATSNGLLNNAAIALTKNASGTYNLTLNDFSFMGMLVGDIFVPNITLTDGKLEATRTIMITSATEGAMGPMLGALPVKVSAILVDTDKKAAAASIDILTSETDLSALFQGIHVDFVPYEVEGVGVDGAEWGGPQHYENVKVSGRVTKETAKFLHINNYVNSEGVTEEYPMTYIDMTAATVDADVTVADIMAGAPEKNNTLIYLPANSKLTDANTVVSGKATALALTEKVALYVPVAFTAGSISFDRTFNTEEGKVSSFVMPFELKADNVEGKLYTFKGINGEKAEFKKLENTETLAANTPCLIVAENAHPFDGVKNVSVAATEGEMTNTVGNAAHIGAYTTQTVTSDATATYYGYQNGEFVKANNGTLNPFRTMIKVTGTVTAQALKLKLNDETTGISEATNEAGKADVYTLDGKCVRRGVAAKEALNGLAKGVYVVNGRKIVK